MLEIMPLYFIALSLLLVTFACEKNDENLQNATIEEVARMINNEIGEATAESEDRCDMIPIGVKPAGGPRGYLVFSSQVSDRQKLEKLVQQYNELDSKQNEENDAFSTADFATEPELILQNRSCIGQGMYAWNPGDILTKHGLSDQSD